MAEHDITDDEFREMCIEHPLHDSEFLQSHAEVSLMFEDYGSVEPYCAYVASRHWMERHILSNSAIPPVTKLELISVFIGGDRCDQYDLNWVNRNVFHSTSISCFDISYLMSYFITGLLYVVTQEMGTTPTACNNIISEITFDWIVNNVVRNPCIGEDKESILDDFVKLYEAIEHENASAQTPFDMIDTTVTFSQIRALQAQLGRRTRAIRQTPKYVKEFHRTNRTKRQHALRQTHDVEPHVLTTNYWRDPREIRHKNWMSKMPPDVINEISSYLGGRRTKTGRTGRRRRQRASRRR